MSIHLRHAAACYQAPDGEVEAVRDVSFDVAQGEFVSLVGPSGCGKSTLLSAIAGLEPLSGGSIRIDGQPVEGTSPKVGFMPQRDQLFEWRNIWDNVTLGLTVRGEKDAAAYAHVSELLERRRNTERRSAIWSNTSPTSTVRSSPPTATTIWAWRRPTR